MFYFHQNENVKVLFTPDTNSSDWESLHRTANIASGLLPGGAAGAAIGSIAGTSKIVIPLNVSNSKRNKQLRKYKYNFK